MSRWSQYPRVLCTSQPNSTEYSIHLTILCTADDFSSEISTRDSTCTSAAFHLPYCSTQSWKYRGQRRKYQYHRASPHLSFQIHLYKHTQASRSCSLTISRLNWMTEIQLGSVWWQFQCCDQMGSPPSSPATISISSPFCRCYKINMVL